MKTLTILMMFLGSCRIDDYAIKTRISVQMERTFEKNYKYSDSLEKAGEHILCIEPYLPTDADYEGGEKNLIYDYLKHLSNFPRVFRKLPIFLDLHIDEKGKVYDVDIFNTNLNSNIKEKIKIIGVNKLLLFSPATNWNRSPRKAVKSIVLENYIKYTP